MAKVMVSIPDDLLERIDGEARRRGSSRSALLQVSARRELGSPPPEAIDAALERARRAMAGVSLGETGELIRRDRDERDRRDRKR